jgi:hypothetical protein
VSPVTPQRDTVLAGSSPKGFCPATSAERLRRSCNVQACARDISERVLAHAIGGVEGVYDRYGYLPEKMDALTKLYARVDRILKTIDW